MNCVKGHMTLPVETGQENVVSKLFSLWQADALRDCDGTSIPETLSATGLDVYSIMCIVRADQEFANQHPEYLHHKYLLSFPLTAMDTQLVIDPLKGYSRDKYELDTITNPEQYWEVRDRTSGSVVTTENWSYDATTESVSISNAVPYHEYTVAFLARQIWDSVSMYNALTNNWQGPRIRSLDPYYPQCREHLKQYFTRWLAQHPQTTVVRFTTFAFLFVIDTGERNQDIYRDWTGYGETVSPLALHDFEKRFGYRLTPEDFVDAGYYNGTYKVPSQRYRDWMIFVQDFVASFANELVEMVHKAGKKAAMFQGDHWIGTEPFLPCYQKIGIDINIGAVEDGVALRRLTDSPGSQVREARFYPYFFPDVFREGNNPVTESMSNWVKIRRAMLRKRVDRIGYGGYLSLANKFPLFIEHVTQISREFGDYLKHSGGGESHKVLGKVAVLNAWGKARSWLQNQARDQRFYIPPRPDVMEFVGNNILECLSGLPFEVEFISFSDILNNGIADDIRIIINTGDAGSAWSGGECWNDPCIVTALREFTGRGGGLLGVGDPSASLRNGRYFQLGDVLGLEKETSLTMGRVASPVLVESNHFLAAALTGKEDLGGESYVYPQADDLCVLATKGQHIVFSAREYGKGRAVYLGSLPYTLPNARLLQNILLWLGNNHVACEPYLSNNPFVDTAYYPATGMLALVNACDQEQAVSLRDKKGKELTFRMKPYQWLWKKFNRTLE